MSQIFLMLVNEMCTNHAKEFLVLFYGRLFLCKIYFTRDSVLVNLFALGTSILSLTVKSVDLSSK